MKEEAMMKNLKWSLLVVHVTSVGVLTIMLRSLRPVDMDANEATEANEPIQAVGRNEGVVSQSAPSATVPVRERPPAIPLTPDETAVSAADIASESAKVVQVRADQVLAKVNDQAILLKDLVPLRADEQEQAMTAEEYESRLNRAIELELTFQAAAAGGVKLTPEQVKRVDGIAQKHEATLRSYHKEGVTWSSVTPAQVQFEQRLTSALMLQQNLVAMEAQGEPSANSATQARIEEALRLMLGRLKSNASLRTASKTL